MWTRVRWHMFDLEPIIFQLWSNRNIICYCTEIIRFIEKSRERCISFCQSFYFILTPVLPTDGLLKLLPVKSDAVSNGASVIFFKEPISCNHLLTQKAKIKESLRSFSSQKQVAQLGRRQKRLCTNQKWVFSSVKQSLISFKTQVIIVPVHSSAQYKFNGDSYDFRGTGSQITQDSGNTRTTQRSLVKSN